MSKPTSLPVWDTNEDNIQEPDSAQKDGGWQLVYSEEYDKDVPEKPPYEWDNWFKNLVYKWLAYFNQATTANYVKVTDDYTAKPTDFVRCDTSGGSFTVTLPSDPNDNDKVTIQDYTSSFEDNPLIVGRNGNKIMGENEDMTVRTDNETFTLIYNDGDWRIA